MLFGYICLRGESALTNHTLLRRTETDVNKEVSSHGVVNPSSSVRSLHSSIHKWFLNRNLLLAFFFFFSLFFLISYCDTEFFHLCQKNVSWCKETKPFHFIDNMAISQMTTRGLIRPLWIITITCPLKRSQNPLVGLADVQIMLTCWHYHSTCVFIVFLHFNTLMICWCAFRYC